LTDYEIEQPEGFMEPKVYVVTLECPRCEKPYKWRTKNLGAREPECPKRACIAAKIREESAREIFNLKKMIEERLAPGHIGENVMVKAIDKTADIVMTDNNLTNLNDNLRPGDTMAPKLPGPMQAAADGFFGGQNMKARGHRARQIEAMGKRAMAGAYRGMAVTPGQLMPEGAKGMPGLTQVNRKI
jgi:hypothetical protein